MNIGMQRLDLKVLQRKKAEAVQLPGSFGMLVDVLTLSASRYFGFGILAFYLVMCTYFAINADTCFSNHQLKYAQLGCARFSLAVSTIQLCMPPSQIIDLHVPNAEVPDTDQNFRLAKEFVDPE